MTSIYTKTGDGGETALFGGGRVGKDDARVEAYGQVDELNSVIGVARAAGLGEMDEFAQELQNQLFTVGSLLATPPTSKAAAHIPKISPDWAVAMERAIDTFDEKLAPLRQFILPGGTAAAAALHHARTVCRRAERRVVSLARDESVPPEVVVYLNRLSDLLFTMARVANARASYRDVPWETPKTS